MEKDKIKLLINHLNENGFVIIFLNCLNNGDILFEFENDKGFYLLDYSNDGEISFLFRDNLNKRYVYDLTNETFLNFIIDFLK